MIERVSDAPAAIPIRLRSGLVLAAATLISLIMFLWPLFVTPTPGQGHHGDAPFVFALVLPVLIAIILSELASGGMDAKALAILGVLSAIGAAIRPMGAGTAGIETVFFLLVLGGRVYGPGFGFVLGSTTLFASALLTGGVGPWLPFQMLGASWVGMGAGLLPWRRLTGRLELLLLCVYGILAAYLYGFLLNFWFWPFLAADGPLAFAPGGAIVTNLHRFLLFSLATSTWGWDTGRAITNTVAILIVGPSVLFTLRRAARRAAWDAPVTFDPVPAADTDGPRAASGSPRPRRRGRRDRAVGSPVPR